MSENAGMPPPVMTLTTVPAEEFEQDQAKVDAKKKLIESAKPSLSVMNLRANLLSKRAPSFELFPYDAKDGNGPLLYAAVRPTGAALEKLQSRTQRNVTKEIRERGSKTKEVAQQSTFEIQRREAYVVCECMYFVGEDRKPTKPVFERYTDETIEELVNLPYEKDGLLAGVGAAINAWLAGRPFELEVEDAKNG